MNRLISQIIYDVTDVSLKSKEGIAHAEDALRTIVHLDEALELACRKIPSAESCQYKELLKARNFLIEALAVIEEVIKEHRESN